MSEQLVANIRLWSVKRAGGVANVLGTEKHAECKPVEEIPSREESRHWS
jgi:hypothetical protein